MQGEQQRRRERRRHGLLLLACFAVTLTVFSSDAAFRGWVGSWGVGGRGRRNHQVLRNERRLSESHEPVLGEEGRLHIRMLMQADEEPLSPEEQLGAASRAGDVSAIQTLLERELVDPNAKSGEQGFTPIMWAAYTGQTDAVKELIRLNANVSAMTDRGISALWIAAHQGHEEVVTELLDSVASASTSDVNGTTPLYVAALRGHESVVGLLIEHGVDLNSPSVGGATPLLAAVHNRHGAVVARLLEAGADPNQQKAKSGQTALWTAAYLKDEEIMKHLLEYNPAVDISANDGTTPLYISITKECLNCAKLLLENGADPNYQRRGDFWSPLHAAASIGFVDGVRLLLDFGAQKDIRDHITRSPFDVIGRLRNLPQKEMKTLKELLSLASPPLPIDTSATTNITTMEPVLGDLIDVGEHSKKEGDDKVSRSSISSRTPLAVWATILLVVLAALVAAQSLYILITKRKRENSSDPHLSGRSPPSSLRRRLSAQSYVPTSPVTVVSPPAQRSASIGSWDHPFSPTQNVPPAPESPETHRPAGHPMLESMHSDFDDPQGRTNITVEVDYGVVKQLYSTPQGPYDGYGNFHHGFGARC